MDEEKDIFDDIIFMEERFQNEGFKQGVELGKKSGYLDGFSLGKEHGVRLGTEIGFYQGFVKGWLVLLKKEGNTRKRVEKVVTSLQGLLDKFSMDDPQRPTILNDVMKIRAKYKQLTSLLNISSEVGSKPATAQQGFSF